MTLKDVRTLIHQLIIGLSVLQAALLAIDKILGGGAEIRLNVRNH